MKKHISILNLIAFIPQLITPIGLYMAGDKDVISIRNINNEYIAYRLPDDDKGAQFKLNFESSDPIYIYANRNKTMFEQKMNPSISEEIAMQKDYVSTSDKHLIGLFHYMLMTNMPDKKLEITDTANILKYLDEAMLMRCGKESKQEINKIKWKSIKEELSDAVILKELKIEQAKTSLVPVQSSSLEN